MALNLDYARVNAMYLGRFTLSEFIYLATQIIKFLEKMQEQQGGGESDLPEVQSAQRSADGVPALYISQELIDAMKADLQEMIELNKQTRSSVETKRLLELDRQRDRLAAYILGVTARASELPDDEDRKLGEELYNELKVYEGIGKLPQDDETVTIRGMLNDIRKEKFAAALTAFGIEKYANQLEEVNEQYAELASQRSDNTKETKKKANNAELRARLSKMLEAVADYAFAANLLHGTEETAAFIEDLNLFIEERKQKHNLRGSNDEEDEDNDDAPTDETPGTETPGNPDGETPEEPDDRPVVQ